MAVRALGLAIGLAAGGCSQLLGIEDVVTDGSTPSGDARRDASGDGRTAPCATVPVFAGMAQFPVTGFTLHTGDLNGDHAPDAIVLTTSDLVVLDGNGSGAFGTAHAMVAGSPLPSSQLVVADLDGDGLDDVITWPLNDGGTTLSVRRQNPAAHGTFLPAQPLTAANPVGSVFVGDLDGQGLPDLFVNDTPYFAHAGAPGTYDAGSPALSPIAVRDLDGDGLSDLVVVAAGDQQSVAFNLATAPGTFSAQVAVGVHQIGVFGHFSGSGARLDALLPGELNTQGGATASDLFVQTASRTFVESRASAVVGISPSGHDGLDLNHDGLDDFVGLATSSPFAPAAAIQCPTAGTFDPGAGDPPIPLPDASAAALFVDVNGDDKPDALELDALGSGASAFLDVSLQQ